MRSGEKEPLKVAVEPRDSSQKDLFSMLPKSARSIKSSALSRSSAASDKIEVARDEERQIVLIDMDAYYA